MLLLAQGLDIKYTPGYLVCLNLCKVTETRPICSCGGSDHGCAWQLTSAGAAVFLRDNVIAMLGVVLVVACLALALDVSVQPCDILWVSSNKILVMAVIDFPDAHKAVLSQLSLVGESL